MSSKGKKYKSYKRLNEDTKKLIFEMYKEKMELRKIARVIGVQLQTIQYHIKKNLKSIN